MSRLTAAVAVVLLSPLMMLIALVVLLDSGRPVLHGQTRLGRDGRPFRILKFRTLQPGYGGERLIAPPGDPRITMAGRFLRRSHLDELPQLFNILRGDMTFVGLRPAHPGLWPGVDPSLRDRALSRRPGLVSPATLDYIGEDEVLGEFEDPERLYRDVVFPARVAEDTTYFEHGESGHARLYLRTFRALLLGRDRAASRERVRGLIADAGIERRRNSQSKESQG